VIVLTALVGIPGLSGCLNPFAPIEGDIGGGSGAWTDQRSVGELLDNFELAYDYRDSLHYAECLAESFVFCYYDVERGHFDRWFRDTDLKATGGLFRNFSRIDLEWNLGPENLAEDIDNFNLPDSTLEFTVWFHLTLGEEVPLIGYAHFKARMGEDRRFRLLEWQDDFYNPE